MLKKVVYDIGHGGTDPGGVANGLLEKTLNLFVGLEAKRYMLENYEVELMLTREDDRFVSLNDRTRMIREFNPNLCISIHHNAAFNVNARGAEVIHAHYDERDDALAELILDKLMRIGMPIRRSFTRLNQHEQDYYHMIRTIVNDKTKSIITEGGFLTNLEDVKMLRDENYLRGQAIAICDAAAKILGLNRIKPHWGQENYDKVKDVLFFSDHDLDNSVTWAQYCTMTVRLLEKLGRTDILNK